MRTKYLNQMKIIEFLIDFREMTFKQICDNCPYARSIHPKTLARTLEELVEAKYLVCRNEKYSLNTEQFLINNHGSGDVWQRLLTCAIESGEIDCYKRIRDFIKPELQDRLLNDEALRRFRETIIEDVRVLNDDENTIKYLKTAIHNECVLQIEYKGNIMQIFPLCIVISRDGVRSYLCGIRKKNILIFELAHVHILKSLGEKTLPDRDRYMEQIQKSWDVEIHDPVHVKILFIRELGINSGTEKQLQSYFGKGKEKSENQIVYEGDVVGINDFKRWIRENMDSCFLIEPEIIRQELIQGVVSKIERYEHNG